MYEKVVAFIRRAQNYAKAIVGGVGVTLTGLSSVSDELGITIIPAEWQPWITLGLGLLTTFSVWAVPNAGTYAQTPNPRENGLGGTAPTL